MALDNGYHIAARALPMPTDTPYETPSRGMSGQLSQQGSSSPFSNFASAPFPPVEDPYFPNEHGANNAEDDERYNSRDTRRLTPNLGISFVSQIHSLKKELESKDAMVGDLEEVLFQSRAKNEQLSEDLDAKKTEVKSVKHQMSSLEHDMLQALEEIAKERDDAIKMVTDNRKQLEMLKRKFRTQEEEADKANVMWEKDKQDWDDDKRKMESKVHVVEERLKTMVAELIAVRSTGQSWPGAEHDVDEGMRETWFVRGNDIRAASRSSNRSIDDIPDMKEATNTRSSRMSGLHEMGGSKMSGLSLADELGGEGDDEDDFDQEGIYSPNALPEEVQMLPARYSEDTKARKIMGLHSDTDSPFGAANSRQHTADIIEEYINVPSRQAPISYTDTATQFTPPSTPTLKKRRMDSNSEKSVEQTEHSANQSRKRVAIPTIFVDHDAVAKSEAPKSLPMVSASCQTDDLNQRRLSRSLATQPSTATTKEMRSSSTQTVEDAASVSKHASTRLSTAPLGVPVIAIHPPASRPTSSHNSVVLPPRTRNAGCQVALEAPRSLKSTSMQTEEIRVDKRPVPIPPRLQLSNSATKPKFRSTERRTRTFEPSIPESSRHRIQNAPTIAAHEITASAPCIPKDIIKSPDLALGVIERRRRHFVSEVDGAPQEVSGNGSLNGNNSAGARRPSRSRSSFAGFEASTGNYEADISKDLSDDDEFANAAPIRKTLSKVQNSWKLVPQSVSTSTDRLEPASEELEDLGAAEVSTTTESKAKALPQTASKTFQTRPTEGYQRTSSAAKPADIRRQALVSSGIAEHAQRASSANAQNAPVKEPPTVPPPFPVPTRSSSRKIPISASEGAASPTPYSTSFFTTRRGQDNGRPPIKRKILRKVQSAAAVTKTPAPQRPQIPPSVSASSTVPGSPKSLPSTQNQFILPYDSVAEVTSRPAVASQSRPHAGEASIEAPTQQTSVVDAIAQTMVGEWMWKYVRKRTSFGITESPQAEFEMSRNGENGNGSGVRHKRWVWLAPYENAVIWSSKQPTSGPALLGKGGRKLMIQSVLDVKDDTPLPKNAGPHFASDRSILILTPQRALKFTAVSRERHYIWLTALSFLSHSTRGMDDLASPPPLPREEFQLPPSQDPSANFRRTPVRDSIRIAKDKSRPKLGAHSFSSPIGGLEQKIIQDSITAWGDREAESEEAAEPPQVPRVAAHARKRSNTGPRPVPLSAFHSYPNNSTAMGSSSSLTAPTSRDKYDRFNPRARGASRSGPNAVPGTMTRRVVTDPNRDSYVAPPPVVPDNFFDPVGTMRMEAFVRNSMIENQMLEPTKEGSKKTKRSYRTKQGTKKDMSYWGVEEAAEGKEDPFTGF